LLLHCTKAAGIDRFAANEAMDALVMVVVYRFEEGIRSEFTNSSGHRPLKAPLRRPSHYVRPGGQTMRDKHTKFVERLLSVRPTTRSLVTSMLMDAWPRGD
jgi:hypothetical protein